MPDPKYYATLNADNGLSLSVLLDSASPSITGGFGGWTNVSRPKRKSLTRWQGNDPVTQNLALIFDGLIAGEGQETNIATLNRMATSPGDHIEPPKITLSGFALRTDLTWVITNLQYDDQNVIWDVIGGVRVRLRQSVVVSLSEFVDATVITTASSPIAQQTQSTHVVKSGETLKQIAIQVYKDPSKYINIIWNNPWLGVVDPSTVIKPGTILNIPGQKNFVVPG